MPFARVRTIAVAAALLASAVACASNASTGDVTPADESPAPNAAIAGGGSRFSVSSYASTYPIQGRFEGSYTIEAESVVVTVRGGAVRNSAPARLGETAKYRDVRVSAGFGRPYGKGWAIDTLAASTTVVAALPAQGEAAVGAMRFAVPRRPGVSLEDRWLIFEVAATHAGLFGRPAGSRFANYVCAEANLLGPTKASQERARRMAGAYSRIC